MNPQTVGGQAVIEGVMMKAPTRLAVALRLPGGEILVKDDPFRSLAARFPLLAKPFIRGPVILGETLVLGMKALSYSAQKALADEEEEEGLGSWALALTMLGAVALGLALFVALPHLLALGLGRVAPRGFDETTLAFHLTDGGLKTLIFLAYLWSISLMKDIRRVFEYHGAEHKAIYCYESGGELSVAAARGYSRLHPRCGTAFLLVVLLVSILIFTVVFPLLPRLAAAAWANQAAQIGLKTVLMLPVAGISYEIIRLAGQKAGHPLCRALLWPGLQLQKLTTREPSDDQIEIALAALKAALSEGAGRETCLPVP
ncbi:MAG: DUF1385 domain-containing protein [Deltaproteobacteria bacterium]|nr:DUF1385 domain-containing protein [Deltaproteobacteria bacterium]